MAAISRCLAAQLNGRWTTATTWFLVQSLGHSGLPENASVAEQNAAFAQEYAQSGGSAWSAYDGC